MRDRKMCEMRIFMNEEKKGKKKKTGRKFSARFERFCSLVDGVAKRKFTHSINIAS